MPMVREEHGDPQSFQSDGGLEQMVWLVLGMARYRDWSMSRLVSQVHLALPEGSGRACAHLIRQTIGRTRSGSATEQDRATAAR